MLAIGLYSTLFLHIERLETDNNTATEQVQRLLGEKHTKSVEIAMLSKELKGLRNPAAHQGISTSKKDKNPLDKYAITIVNSNGKVTSPFVTGK